MSYFTLNRDWASFLSLICQELSRYGNNSLPPDVALFVFGLRRLRADWGGGTALLWNHAGVHASVLLVNDILFF